MRNSPLVQLAAAAVGATFVLLAVLGFVPGITTNYSELSFAVAGARSSLIGGGIVYLVLTLVLGKQAAHTTKTGSTANAR